MKKLRMSLSLGSLFTGRHRYTGYKSSASRGGYLATDVWTIPCDVAGPVSHLCRVDEWMVQSEDGVHSHQLRGL